MKNNLSNKAQGCLVGLACGDYLGMPYEFLPAERTRAYFQSHKLEPVKVEVFGKKVVGFYTDDTSQMICLAESLIENGFDTRDQFKRYIKWLNEGYATPFGDKAYGVGKHTLQALTRQSETSLPTKLVNDPKAGGNGALMRCAPIALRYYQDTSQLINCSIKSAVITHNNTIAAWCCVILNLFIAYALQNIDKNLFCKKALNEARGLPSDLQNLLKTDFHSLNAKELETTGYSLNTLKIAFYAFFVTKSFEDCLTKAISIGGDTDTQGAVAGALAGAYYGYSQIPLDWRKNLIKQAQIKCLANNLLIDETLHRVCRTVLSTKRAMPAHFTSNGDRTQSFCVDFDIEKTDEYCMASEAWYEGGKAVSDLYKEYGKPENNEEQNIIIKIGEDIMIGAYIATKLGVLSSTEALQKLITDKNLQAISTEKDTLVHMINTFQIQGYFEHCGTYGSKRASSSLSLISP